MKEVGGKRVVSYGTSSYGYDIRCPSEFKIFATKLKNLYGHATHGDSEFAANLGIHGPTTSISSRISPMCRVSWAFSRSCLR